MKNSLNNKEKEELLFNHNMDFSIKNYNKKLVLKFFIIMLFAIALIAIRLNIYEYSKLYAELKDKKEVLSEENKELQRKIEALQFKNKITNYFEVQYGK